MGTELKFLPHSAPVSFDGWGFGFGEFDSTVAKRVAEGIAESLKEEEWVHASLPFIWAPKSDGLGGEPVSDPLAVYFQVTLFDEQIDRGLIWSTSIRELVLES